MRSYLRRRSPAVYPLIQLTRIVPFVLFSPIVVLAQPIAQDQRVAVLRMMEAEIRANYDGLITLSGSYDLQDGAYTRTIRTLEDHIEKGGVARARISETAGRWWQVRRVSVQFALDAKANKLLTTYETIGDLTVTDLTSGGEQLHRQVPFRARHLLTSEEWIDATPAVEDASFPIARGKGINSAFRHPPEDAARHKDYGEVIDPRTFYAFNSRRTFADSLKLKAEWLMANKPIAFQIEKTDSDSMCGYRLIQELRVGSQDEAPTVLETTYDAGVGYNPIKLVERSPAGHIVFEREWKYKRISGIFVPAKYQITKYVDDDSRERVLSRTFTYRTLEVNKPLGSDLFSYDRLGLVAGDQMLDRGTGAITHYDGKQMLPVP